MNRLIETARAFSGTVYPGEPMCAHTTFKIGGKADLLLLAQSMEELTAYLAVCRKDGIPCFIMGNGSNLLVRDAGIEGAVIQLGDAFSFCSLSGQNMISCGAGVKLSAACQFAAKHHLSGMEFAFGIPGTVGGAVYMNAGAYGGEMSQIIHTVTHLTTEGKLETLPAQELDFRYRHSFYHTASCCILSAQLRLSPGNPGEINETMRRYMTARKEKQPLEFPSAGSVFKRPSGHFAGRLIEQAGLKGKQVGGAQVSEKHAGFIINTGGATCEDVLNLIHIIQDTVYQHSGVHLECEVRAIGRDQKEG